MDTQSNKGCRLNSTELTTPKSVDKSKGTNSVQLSCSAENAVVEGPNSGGDGEKKKKKKKKLPKAERQKRKEEAKMKSIYGPKDSHVQLISASTLQKLNAANTSQFSRAFMSASSSQTESRPVTFSAEDFPSFTQNKQQQSLQSHQADSTPYFFKSRILQSEFPALSSTPHSLNKSNETSIPTTGSSNLIPSPSVEHKSVLNPVEAHPSKIRNAAPVSSNSTHVNSQNSDVKCGLPAASSESTQSRSEPIILGASDCPAGSNKKKSKKPLIISIDALIAKKKPVVNAASKTSKRLRDLKSSAASKSVKQTLGNILDSSGPMVIHRGKIREKPRKKKLTRLKKAILVSRSLRAENLKASPPSAKDLSADSHNSSLTTGSTAKPIGNTETPKELQVEQPNEKNSMESTSTNQKGRGSHMETKESVPNPAENLAEDQSNNTVARSESESESKSNNENSKSAAETCEYKSKNENILATLLNTVIQEQIEAAKSKRMEASKSNQHDIDTSTDNLKDTSLTVLQMEDVISPELFTQAKKMLHNRKFRPYCDMYTSKELHGSVVGLMKELHRFQDRLYHTDPIKFQSKRRFVHGLKDAFTYLQLNKVVLVILAPDMESNNEKGGLDEKIREIKKIAAEKKVPVIYSGNRYILGKPCFIKSQVSAIAILDKQGAEDLYRAVIDESTKLRVKYAEDFNQKIKQVLASQSNNPVN